MTAPTLPEEAVKAALEHYSEGGCMGLDARERREVTVDMLTAAAPHLHWAVRKLEWVATGQTGFLETEFYAVAGPLMHTVHPLKDVDGPFNEHYSIHRDWNDREAWRLTYYVGNNGLSGISKACKSLEAAKAAAQADYEARIRAAIEVGIPTTEPSAARSLALEEGFRKGLEAACGVIDAHSEHDRQLCCDGRGCGCYGATVHQSMQHYIRALSSPDHADAGKVEGDGGCEIEYEVYSGDEWQAASTDLDGALDYALMYALDGMENITVQEVRRRTVHAQPASEGAE